MTFWNRKSPKDDPASLGNVLLEYGYCTQEQLDEALSVQKQSRDLLLGETLLFMGVISHQQLEVAIARQKVVRNPGNGSINGLADLAMARTSEVCKRFDGAHALAIQATEKLK